MRAAIHFGKHEADRRVRSTSTLNYIITLDEIPTRVIACFLFLPFSVFFSF